MSRKARVLSENTYYHVYNRGVNKGDIFWDDYDKQLFLRMLIEVKRRFELQLFAYCLMQNHFHLFVHTRHANLNVAMRELLRRYVWYINARHGRVGPLFQSRYQSKPIDSDPYAIWLVNYIHRNPIEAGMSSRCSGYAWSSYRYYVDSQHSPKWLDAAWVLAQFHDNPSLAQQLFVKFHQGVPGQPGQPVPTFDFPKLFSETVPG